MKNAMVFFFKGEHQRLNQSTVPALDPIMHKPCKQLNTTKVSKPSEQDGVIV